MPPEKILAVDTEDDSKGTVYLINFYDGHHHATFRSRIDAWNWLKNQGPAVVWACNMEYDLINLFGDWVDKMLTLTFNSSCFIKAYWPGCRIRFLDTLRHWPMSVKSMGDFIKLPKLEPKGEKDRFDDVLYCQRDTEIVWKFVSEMSKRYEFIGATVESTLPSSAFKLFKSRYAEINLQRPNDEICEQLMGAAYGGRVEIFRTGLLDGDIRCYDINSLYPFCMAEMAYPQPDSGSYSIDFDLKHEGIAEVELDYPGRHSVPCLPFRKGGKLIFPVGRLRGTWTMPELRQAHLDGATIRRVFWFYRYRKTCRPFKKYVETIYELRQGTDDPLMNYTLKIFMNSVYGKFTESGELTIYKNGQESKLSRRPEHSNIVLSAYTTAYGRLVLLDALRKYQDCLLYCDTDSVFLLNPPRVDCGRRLGEWKEEARYRTAQFVLPKCYMAVDFDGNKKNKVKGVPRSAAADFFQSYSAEYNAPLRFRESRRRLLSPNVWGKKIRSLKSKYEKRTVKSDGTTCPIVIK